MIESLLWLALNIYHEARNQDQFDQLAVAHVTINRMVKRNLSIKEVVLQPFQFSWTHQKKDYIPYDKEAFKECEESAIIALSGFDFTGGATHYHNKGVIPEWTNRMVYLGTFGDHIFYKRRN